MLQDKHIAETKVILKYLSVNKATHETTLSFPGGLLIKTNGKYSKARAAHPKETSRSPLWSTNYISYRASL